MEIKGKLQNRRVDSKGNVNQKYITLDAVEQSERTRKYWTVKTPHYQSIKHLIIVAHPKEY